MRKKTKKTYTAKYGKQTIKFVSKADKAAFLKFKRDHLK